jgi:hypothetical protein
MKRLRLLGLAILAIFALGAATSATVSATEAGLLYLEKSGFTLTFTGSGLSGELTVGLNSIKCSIINVKGESKEAKHVILGSGTIDFIGCKLSKEKIVTACNTEGDAKETILLPADFHFFNALKGPELESGIGILILKAPLKIKCAAGTSLVEVKGWALGLVLTTNLTSDLEVVELHFFAEREFCDFSEAFCEKVEEKEPLEANFTSKFEKASLVQLVSLLFNQGMLVDD